MKVTDNIDTWRMIESLSKNNGVRGASLELNWDFGKTSRLIQKFEQETGLHLLDHHVRPVRLHEEFLELMPLVRQCIEAHEKVMGHIQCFGEKELTLKIGIPANNPRESIYGILKAYEQIDPNVRFQTYTDADHTSVLLGAVDLAYLPYRPVAENLFIWSIGTIGNVPLASPNYLRQHGTPQFPEDLRFHDVIVRWGENYPITKSLHRGTESRPFVCRNIAFAGDVASGKQAVLSGDGIAIDLSIASCLTEIQEGRLVPVLNGWHRPDWDKTLVMSRSQLSNKRLVRFGRYFAKHEAVESQKRVVEIEMLKKKWFS